MCVNGSTDIKLNANTISDYSAKISDDLIHLLL